MHFLKNRSNIYLIPYLLLLALGVWYRYKISGLALFDGDSDHYLIPPIVKALTGEWHKGERPMQYLLFIYFTLSEQFGVKYTVIVQQVLGIFSAALLAGAWLSFIKKFRANQWLWHITGYVMLGVYISSPVIMYYEQFIGPESPCIFVMSLLIYLLSLALSDEHSNRSRTVFISAALYINLYLVNPMPKWVFVSLFLELLLIYAVLRYSALSRKGKAVALIVPHLFYLLTVWLPETTHKIDKDYEDRVYIEYEQMVYTHFDLLAQDKNNLGLTPALRDSMMEYYRHAQTVAPQFLIKFSSDDLMWGPANNLVEDYYHSNYDSIKHYYMHLNWILATRYPVGLAGEITKQLCAFYIPNHIIRKDMFSYVDIYDTYDAQRSTIHRFDKNLTDDLRTRVIPGSAEVCFTPENSKLKYYLLSRKYPENIAKNSSYDVAQLPLLFTWKFLGYRFFDYIFLSSMLGFLALRIYERRFFEWHIISIIYLVIFIYVSTISIVHTFDISRFIITIYPFILIAPCMASAYFGDFMLQRLRRG